MQITIKRYCCGWLHPILRIGYGFAVALFFCSAASAHHARGHAVPSDSIAIPSLSHGQMAVIAANRSQIVDLAHRMPRTDSTFLRLSAFINLQFSACMWGLIPGSVDDESSPFNECTHAYLAATKALLLHMQGMADNREAVRALVDKVQREMIFNRTSLIICRFSDEPFNTSERIFPRWIEVVSHPPSLLTFAGFGSIFVGAIWAFMRLTSSSSKTPAMSIA